MIGLVRSSGFAAPQTRGDDLDLACSSGFAASHTRGGDLDLTCPSGFKAFHEIAEWIRLLHGKEKAGSMKNVCIIMILHGNRNAASMIDTGFTCFFMDCHYKNT